MSKTDKHLRATQPLDVGTLPEAVLVPREVIVAGQRCLVTNCSTFSGVKHYGIIFKMLPMHHKEHEISDGVDSRTITVTESIGWVPATLCEEVA